MQGSQGRIYDMTAPDKLIDQVRVLVKVDVVISGSPDNPSPAVFLDGGQGPEQDEFVALIETVIGAEIVPFFIDRAKKRGIVLRYFTEQCEEVSG